MSSVEKGLSHLPALKEITKKSGYLLIHDLQNSPPQIIYVFDNYRGEDPVSKELAQQTMETRAALAALLYHSGLYWQDQERPYVASFAGEHQPSQEAGSHQVAGYLEHFGVPRERIILRTDTITTNSDMMSLHYVIKKERFTSVALATTDDHVVGAALEWINHFHDHKTKHKIPNMNIVSPSRLKITPLFTDPLERLGTGNELLAEIDWGTTDLLRGKFSESTGPDIIRRLPKPIRKHLQPFLERMTHGHIPHALTNRLRETRALKRAHH